MTRPPTGQLFVASQRDTARSAPKSEKPAREPDSPGSYTCPSCNTRQLFRNPIPAGVNCTSCWFRDGRLIPCLWTPDPKETA